MPRPSQCKKCYVELVKINNRLFCRTMHNYIDYNNHKFCPWFGEKSDAKKTKNINSHLISDLLDNTGGEEA